LLIAGKKQAAQSVGDAKKAGGRCGPGAIREFQFHECADLGAIIKSFVERNRFIAPIGPAP
jgi:hypothetical protein